jgi:hypothetical protein
MGLNDPQVRVGTSGSSPALARNYSLGAAVAGHVFTSSGPDTLPVNEVLFVDSVNSPGATSDGTLAAPYATIQAAVNRAMVLALPRVQIQIAPGNYAGAIAIPEALTYCALVGWGPSDDGLTTISGDITAVTSIGSSNRIALINLWMMGDNIAADLATHDLTLDLWNVVSVANITAFNTTIDFRDCNQSGDITCGGGFTTNWDGISWSWRVRQNFMITVAGVYSREFYDTGANEYFYNLTINGLAIGATGFVDIAIPDVRSGDYGVVQVRSPPEDDFITGFHSSTAGSMKFWITNLSRVSTNFGELCRVLIFHGGMAIQPPP